MKTLWRILGRYHQRRAKAIYRSMVGSSDYERARDHAYKAENFFARIKGAV